MRHSPRWIAGTLIASLGLLSACATVEEPSAAETGGAAVKGNGQVVVEAEAMERLDIQTTSVQNAARGSQLVVPYAAVVYGADGETWAYESPKDRTFQRATIIIDRIDGGKAFLSDGPRPGTQVVIQGAQELLGVEIGIDQ
jgi:hypothetical protein